MGDKENALNGSLYYCGSPIELPQPLVNLELSSEQSDDEKAKWNNLCSQTIEITTKVQYFDKHLKRLFYGKWVKIPRKLKKRIKRDYFIGYTKRISHCDLVNAYLLNNPKKH